MDFLQKLGGRKFLLALIAVGLGTWIELTTDRGLSPTFATLLGTLVASFSIANYAVTKEHMGIKAGGSPKPDGLDDIKGELTEIKELAVQANNPEAIQAFVSAMTSLQKSVIEVQQTTGQIGQAVVGLNRKLDTLR